MKLLDSRRLTGPNLQTVRPAALLEVEFDEGEAPQAAIAAWRVELGRLFDEGELLARPIVVRRFRGGAALCVEAPVDELLATTEVNEWAAERATALLAGRDPGPVEPRRSELRTLIEAGHNPRLMALREQAHRRGVPVTWDDTELTLGQGARSLTFPLDGLPDVAADAAAIAWERLGAIPVALVTGTNGKTTTTRLAGRIAERGGRRAGACSTVDITIGGVPVEEGDWTGPAAARRVLRDHAVELAILETARGGILRRGLAVERCDVAVITNVSADHLGTYGVDDVATMAQVKAVVARAAGPGGKVVLSADDPVLVELAGALTAEVVYFSLDAYNPVILAHRARGGEVWFATTRLGELGSDGSDPGDIEGRGYRDALLVRALGGQEHVVIAAADVPITFGGAAAYNVANALAAAALAASLGIDEASIAAGLRDFGPSPGDNPGRGNLIAAPGGARLLLDYGHNPEGIRAALSLAGHLRGGARLVVIVGQPGDRSDEAMGEAGAAVAAAHPDAVVLHDMPEHLRGRDPGAVPALLRRELIARGLPPEVIAITTDEPSALGLALDGARPGDLLVVLPHTDEEPVARLLADRAAALATSR